MKTLKEKADSFAPEKIARVSFAAAPLASWVKANIRFSFVRISLVEHAIPGVMCCWDCLQVLEKIQPLEHGLAEADAVLRDSQLQLERNQQELSTIDHRVGELKGEYGRRMSEASQLQILLAKTEDTLDRAQKLLGQLSGERARWENTVKELRGEMSSMPTRMLLAAGFVTYLAKTPEDVRQSALEGWSKLCEISESFDFMRVRCGLRSWQENHHVRLCVRAVNEHGVAVAFLEGELRALLFVLCVELLARPKGCLRILFRWRMLLLSRIRSSDARF